MANDGVATVQKWAGKSDSVAAGNFSALARAFLLTVQGTLTSAPVYWTASRDEWTSQFWRQEGNDLLAGAIATLVAKVTAANWYIEGPLAPALVYRDILLHKSDFYGGWDNFIAKWTLSYIDRDGGGLSERGRTSLGDHDGPALGFMHLDEDKILRTFDDPEYPFIYTGGDKPVKMHRSQVMQILDMPSPREQYRTVGFCSVSRALATSLIMMDIVRYKRERLSDLPPAGLLILSNLTDTQWEDVLKTYDARQRNEGNTTWRDILVLCGVDPSYETHAELFEFSSLPEHFDDKTATETTVYTLALALRMAPQELWPGTSGPLGTATEAEIAARKAKAKGEGIIFTAIERQLNSPLSMPEGLKFGFDFRDDEDDMRKAEIIHQKLQNIRLMWETSPNRGEPEGIITTDEARMWAIREDVIPPDILGMTLELEKVYDVRVYGPMVRVYKDGMVLML